MASKMVGLDLGAREIRVCEVSVGFSNVELVSAYVAPVIPEVDEPLHRAQLRAASDLLNRHKLIHEPLAVGLPRGMTSTMLLDFPFKQSAKLQEVLPFELEEALPFDIEDVFYADMVVRELEGDGVELLVAYALDDQISDFFEEMKEFGLNPKLLTLSGLSLPSLDLTKPIHHGAQVLLDLGELGSEWVINRAGIPSRIHRMDVGGEAVTRALAEAFKVELEPAEQGKLREASLFSRSDLAQIRSESARARAQAIHLAVEKALQPVFQELKRTLAAYERETGEDVVEVQVMGGSAQLGGLMPYLASMLNVDVKMAQAPVSLIEIRGEEAKGAMRFHSAYGMAMALAKRLDRKLVNFRRDRFAYQGDADAMKAAIIWIAISLLCSISLYGVQISFERDQLSVEVAQLEDDVRQLSTQLMGNDSFDIDSLKVRVNATKGASAEVPETSALDTLGELSSKLSKEVEVEFDLFNVTMPPGGRGRLEIRGKTQTVGDVSAIIGALESGHCFTKVKKDSVSKSVDGRTSFKLSAPANCK